MVDNYSEGYLVDLFVLAHMSEEESRKTPLKGKEEEILATSATAGSHAPVAAPSSNLTNHTRFCSVYFVG